MANKQINDLVAKLTQVDSDEFEIQETAGGLSKKITRANLLGNVLNGTTVSYTIALNATLVSAIQSASNVGTAGVVIFDGAVGTDLTYKKINAVDAKITVTDDAINKKIDIGFGNVASTDLTDGASLYKAGGTKVAIADGGTNSGTAGAARTALGVDAAGTDNSIDVTLAGALNYITIIGQVITRNLINLASHVTGILPIANGGTNSGTAGGARTALGLAIGVDVQAYTAVLQNTTVSYTAALDAKLTRAEQKCLVIAVSAVATAITAGVAKRTFRMPWGFTLTDVRISSATAPTGAKITVDINEAGVSILSTKLTIDIGQKTSTTAAIQRVISDSALADDAEMTIDIDTVGTTVAGTELIAYLIGVKT